MSAGQKTQSHDFLVAQVKSLLQQYDDQEGRIPLREQAHLMMQIQETVRQLGIAIAVRAGFSASSAKERIRSYLQAAPNQVVEGMELAVISGISEYGRRVRALREAGVTILTGPEAVDPISGNRLRTDQYILVSDDASSPSVFM